MLRLLTDVRFAVTHNVTLKARSIELASSMDDLLLQHLYTHQSMRLLVKHAYRNAQYSIVPDAASLAREQIEKIYQAIIIAQNPLKWMRQYLRNAWRHDYEQYLLDMDEFGHIERFRKHLDKGYSGFLEKTRRIKLRKTDPYLVSDFAKRVVEYQWHNRKGTESVTKPAWFKRKGSVNSFITGYFYFPSPWDVMKRIRNRKMLRFLDRWYREYRKLSEYSHVLIGKVTPQRMSRDKSLAAAEKAQLYGRKKAETFIVTSNIAAASLCTVIMPYIPNDYGTKAATREFWETLSSNNLLAKAFWNLYADEALR